MGVQLEEFGPYIRSNINLCFLPKYNTGFTCRPAQLQTEPASVHPVESLVYFHKKREDKIKV